MMDRWGETILGAIVIAVAGVFFFFAAAQAGQSSASKDSYELTALFQRVDGVSVGSDVRVSGVKVGVVKSITLAPDQNYYAKLTFAIDKNVEVLDDSAARVATNGLLGGAYISIEPAGLDPLAPGGEIPHTNGSVDLLTVLSSALQGMGQNSNANSNASGASQ